MAATNIWTEYHLTNGGWVAGTRNHEFRIERDRPSNAVRTVKVRDFYATSFGTQHTRHVIWQNPTAGAQIDRLIAMFGDAPDIA
ncbi:MAG: hypothetical protein ABL879_10855 [Devosia sp.]